MKTRHLSGLSFVDLAMLAVVFIWGFNVTVSKVALATIHPMAFIFVRFVPLFILSSLILLVQAKRTPRERPRTKTEWKALVGLGLAGQSIYSYFFSYGIAETSTFHASLLVSASPLFIALLAIFFRFDRLETRHWLGLLLSFVGLALFLREGASGGGETGATLRGDLLILGATICWAIYTVGSKPVLRKESPLGLTCWSVVLGSPVIFLYTLPDSLAQSWSLSWVTWSCVAYATLFPIFLAYLIWSWGVVRIGPVRTSIYSYLVPLVTALTSYLWLGEKVSPSQAAFALIVIAGMALTRFGLPLRPRGTQVA